MGNQVWDTLFASAPLAHAVVAGSLILVIYSLGWWPRSEVSVREPQRRTLAKRWEWVCTVLFWTLGIEAGGVHLYCAVPPSSPSYWVGDLCLAEYVATERAIATYYASLLVPACMFIVCCRVSLRVDAAIDCSDPVIPEARRVLAVLSPSDTTFVYLLGRLQTYLDSRPYYAQRIRLSRWVSLGFICLSATLNQGILAWSATYEPPHGRRPFKCHTPTETVWCSPIWPAWCSYVATFWRVAAVYTAISLLLAVNNLFSYRSIAARALGSDWSSLLDHLDNEGADALLTNSLNKFSAWLGTRTQQTAPGPGRPTAIMGCRG
jgi:hypothetical protein